MTYITSVMCHEMAHIEVRLMTRCVTTADAQHMNHGPGFQKVRSSIKHGARCSTQLMADIKADVRQMQARGYFGDGKLFSRPLDELTCQASGQMGTDSRIASRWEEKVFVGAFNLWTDSALTKKNPPTSRNMFAE